MFTAVYSGFQLTLAAQVWKYLGNLGTWELHVGSRFYGFIVIDGNEIANFETKTMSLILKFDLKFANFTSKFEVY